MSNPLYHAIGLMSGTSRDGIDAALVASDGYSVTPKSFISQPYAPGFRQSLAAAIAAAQTGNNSPARTLEAELTQAHVQAVEILLKTMNVHAEQIDLLGFHGHTIVHQPHRRRTWQLGNGQALADLTNIATIAQFRQADVAAGGQGAPLAPLYHHARLAAYHGPRPVAILNLGGVGNISWAGQGSEELLAFDTGPANALIDDWVAAHNAGSYDKDGALARAGNVHASVLDQLRDHPYFDQAPPKSLDRDDFSLNPARSLSLEDGAATLSAFTIACVADTLAHLPEPPRAWFVTGGGRHNRFLMEGLAAALPGTVAPVEALGWQADAVEAQAFGFLAIRSKLGLSLSLPGTTGVPHPLPGGMLYTPRR